MEPTDIQQEIISLNSKALSLLTSQKFSLALNSLKQAESKLLVLPKSPNFYKLSAKTYANFGILYKEKNQYLEALRSFNKARNFEGRAPFNALSRAEIHLNLCELYSESKSPELAAAEGVKAVELLKAAEVKQSTLLVKAYSKTGDQYSVMLKHRQAADWYKLALDAVKEDLGGNHVLAQDINKRYIWTIRKLRSGGKDLHDRTTLSPLLHGNCRKKKSSVSESRLEDGNFMIRQKQGGLRGHLFQARFLTGEKMIPMFQREFLSPKPRETDEFNGKVHILDRSRLNRVESTEKNKKVRKKDSFSQIIKLYKKTPATTRAKRGLKTKGRTRHKIARIEHKTLDREPETEEQLRLVGNKEIIVENQESLQGDTKGGRLDEAQGTQKQVNPLNLTQAVLRGTLIREKTRFLGSQATVIQKHFRRYQCQELYKSIQGAVVYIQSVYRGHRVRKSLT